MAHSTSSAAATVVASTFSTSSYHKNTRVASLGCISASASSPSHRGSDSDSHAVSVSNNKEKANRRIVVLGVAGAMVGSIWHEQSAFAAARRPPPPPPEEKKDPNISGVQAKVLASKKRKEAMRESIAKLREKGKPIGPSPAE